MLDTDISALRQRAIDVFQVGVTAADPAKALRTALQKHPLPKPTNNGKYIIIAVGKAACKMADCTIKHLSSDDNITAIAVTNSENVAIVNRCEVLEASHPVPNKQGLQAGLRVKSILSVANASDIVVMLISGGASALLPAPIPGIDLQDKIQVNNLLLSSGLDIYETNLVRQCLSQLKGGGALKLAQPADVHSYILSDVLGDDLRVVGSGLSTCAIGTILDARRLLIEKGIFAKLPKPVRTYLENAIPESPSRFPDNVHLIASNQISLSEMARAANAILIQTPLIGDVQEAAVTVVNTIKKHKTSNPIALAFGGETTVKLQGKGKGGRNQELALRVACEAKKARFYFPWCFLSGGTDGRDGPTDAAGGITDNNTLNRLHTAGLDAKTLLSENNSYVALKASGDLLITNSTGTNVADLQLFLTK